MWRLALRGRRHGSLAGGFAAAGHRITHHRTTPEVVDQYREAQPLTLGQP
jgi:hypothetical protein